MKTSVVVLTEEEQRNAERHANHRTSDCTTFSSVRAERYCLECGVRYTTGSLQGYYREPEFHKS